MAACYPIPHGDLAYLWSRKFGIITDCKSRSNYQEDIHENLYGWAGCICQETSGRARAHQGCGSRDDCRRKSRIHRSGCQKVWNSALDHESRRGSCPARRRSRNSHFTHADACGTGSTGHAGRQARSGGDSDCGLIWPMRK